MTALELNKQRMMTGDRTVLRCVDMIHSLLAYGKGDMQALLKDKSSFKRQTYLRRYDEELGEDVVDKVIDDCWKDFQKAILIRDVYTDSEGVSYNSIKWEDEIC